jgi:hypothetical protein
MAGGAGLPSVMTVSAADQVAQGARFLIEAPAPRFLLVRVTDGPPSVYKRDLDPAACRLRFRNAYLGTR